MNAATVKRATLTCDCQVTYTGRGPDLPNWSASWLLREGAPFACPNGHGTRNRVWAIDVLRTGVSA